MSTIGIFTPANDGGWIGSIQTLTINAKLRLVPNDNRDSDNAPAFRVFSSQSRIGDAWEARPGGENPKNYLRSCGTGVGPPMHECRSCVPH